MGYAIMHGRCIGCRRLFSFNPIRVPSITWKGTREPICEDCVAVVNPKRKANGLQPIMPAADAYDAVDEHELPND